MFLVDSFQESSLDSQELFICQELGGDPVQTGPDTSASSLTANLSSALELSQPSSISEDTCKHH